MADGGVKAEIKPEIKLDPGEDGTRDMADIDAFEDDHDLMIPPSAAQGGPTAWLVKLPKDMWEAWSKVYADAPEDEMIEIGKMRVYHQVPDDDVLKQKIQIRLHEKTPQHQNIPKNYHLKLSTAGYSNTCVFSEKDLPGHKPSAIGRNRHLQPGSKPSGIQPKNDRYGQGGQANSGRPTYRTAIPKQTALVPQIQHEANAVPIEDDAYYAHIAKIWQDHVAPKSRTTYIEGIDRGMHPGVSNLNTLGAFGLSSKPKQSRGHKVVKEKAVRMERSQLMDALNRCFRRYRYWSMRALRNELKQPEAWIKENLEQIATLVRSGDFAMNWVLKPEYQGTIIKDDDDVKEEVAKVESGTDMASGDEMLEDDDEGDEFEDVKMEGS
ncbi:hypothetical protein B0A50_01863 [Salinomyces thailandicus]|uniref:Transcription initiation factor IIF subunit beta n=1 Tax=Salinomyces thailandicus TaxID=706561 RepID=A0A4U0U9H7_9PEZI|nr:hypothetical protein B0A50_01863 [Salinomyces thailandica]